MTRIVDLIDVSNVLGESPVWDERIARLWWTDIHARRLHFWDWDSRKAGVIDLPRRLCSFVLTDDPAFLACAFAAGFALLHPATGQLQWLHEVEPDYRGIRLNDGRIDRAGRFWSGSMIENRDVAGGATGSLYRLDPDGSLSTHFDGIAISNSLCFSVDGKTLYFADTPTGRIDKFDLLNDGTLANRRQFAHVADKGRPDGSEIDNQNRLWNAEWGAWQLTCYRPDGAIDEQVKLPVSRPTCPAFGGPDLNHIFVTTSQLELDAESLAREPDAGKVLILESEVQGLPAPKFQLDEFSRGAFLL